MENGGQEEENILTLILKKIHFSNLTTSVSLPVDWFFTSYHFHFLLLAPEYLKVSAVLISYL